MDSTSCGAVVVKTMMLPVESSDETKSYDGTLGKVCHYRVRKYLYGATQWRVATILNH